MDLGVKTLPFTSSNVSWKSGDGVSGQFPVGLRVLVVDDDPTCLRILEKMLKNCLYQVTTCNRAEIALDFLRGNRNAYDVVISDVHMPDMDGFKLLEYVGLEMDLPVIMMSADDSKNVVMKGVTHGACDYLIKPVRMEALKNIWQHVVRKKKHEWKDNDFEQSGQQNRPEDLDYSSSASEGNWSNPKKRKDEEDETEERDDSSALKKPRVVWSIELHQQFVSAVNQLGIDKAVPKKILDLMNVPGLTRENVASHLQKYRLYLRRLSGVSQHPIGNPFAGPSDFPFGPMSSLNAVDLQALAASGQIPPHSLATIQASVLSRATAKNSFPSPHLANQRNIFSFDNPKPRFLDGPQQPNNNNSTSNQVNLLHGIPTNMHVRMVQPQPRTQNFNEVNLSVSQPISGQMGVSNPSIDFSGQNMGFSGNRFSLAGNAKVNTEVNRSQGFVRNYDALSGMNRNRAQDLSLQNVGSGFEGQQQRGRGTSVNMAGFSVGNTGNVGQQVNSSLGDNLLSNNKVVRTNNMGFQNGFGLEQIGQEDLMSALLKEQQEGVGPIENDFSFDGYHLDNLPV
ncbi:hypothetical protein CASFOL_030116 [Castilleja foliolosa]|uniref:Two-component response regulator n=1 Tax=Castilleja foliolosa TaxID=1961234 RepID=A0ABD3CCX5_9LAMI